MVLSMEKWIGKVAIVTGAGAGCGASIAKALVKNGLKVVGLDRREEKIHELSNRLQNQSGKFYAFKCDITEEKEIVAAFEWVKNNLGPVHVLINNAGIAKPSNLIDGDPGDWLEVLKTNVLGLAIATKLAVRDMIDNQIDGQIIHINSALGHFIGNVPDLNVYPATKFAVTALTETLRRDLNSIESKIKITSISPGPIKTEFQSGLLHNEDMKNFIAKSPKLLAEDVADATLYVLSTPPHAHVQELMIRPIGENI